MTSFEQPPYSDPVSEGMQYGPFPPPELDEHPTSAQWIMDQVDGDLYLYQLKMLDEGLYDDHYHERISDEFYTQNVRRLDRAMSQYRLHETAQDMRRLKPDRKFMGKEDK